MLKILLSYRKINICSLCILLILIKVQPAVAQSGVGISTESLTNGVIFEMGQQWGGLLIPRLSLKKYADITTVPLPITNGTLIYNINSPIPEGFYFWKQNKWNYLTTSVSNVYTTNGTLDSDRSIKQNGHTLQLESATGKKALTIKRTNNKKEQGISFKNNTGEFTASMFMDTPNGSAFKIATGKDTDVTALPTTVTFNDDRSILFNNYGQGINTGNMAQILGVDATGLVYENPSTTITNNIYMSNGSLTGDRIISTSDLPFRINNSASGNRGMEIQSPTSPTDVTSPFKFFTNNSFTFKVNALNSFNIYENSKVQLGSFGKGTITGTTAYLLGVDATGNVIELYSPSAGIQFYSFSQTATSTPSTTDTETNLVALKSGGYQGLLDYASGAQAAMQPANDRFMIKMIGTYTVKTAGTFSISSNSDDGARVYVDEALILNAWQDSSNIRGDGSVYLSKGKHRFTFYYYENGGGEHFTFRWENNPDGLTGTMLGAQFTIE